MIEMTYSTHGCSGRVVIYPVTFFPTTKKNLQALKRKIIDLQWSWMTRQEYYRQMLEGIREARRQTLLDQQHLMEDIQAGKIAKTPAFDLAAHCRRALQQLDHNQEVIKQWQQEPK